MYRVALVAVMLSIGLGACTAQEVTELSMTVQTDGKLASIMFREVDHPECTCSAGNFPQPGSCVSNTDVISCSCDYAQLASCVERVSALEGGVLMSSVEPADFLWVRKVDIDVDGADELLVEGCGGSASMPLPEGPYPTATITDAAVVENEQVRLQWTTMPDASYVVTSVVFGLDDETCMENNVGWRDFSHGSATGNPPLLYITPVGLERHATPLGNADVWYGIPDQHARCQDDIDCPGGSRCNSSGVCQVAGT
jgi:hypothetical protein